MRFQVDRRGARQTLLCLLTLVPSLAARAETPRERLQEIAAAYRALGHYADRGEFSLTLRIADKPSTTTQPAAITLSRPNKLRIEAGLARLVCDGETLTTLVEPAKKYAKIPAPRTLGIHHVTEGPVGSLLIGGPSGPSLLMVLGLLLGDDPARGVLDVGGELTIEPNVALDGQDCQVLSIAAPSGTTYRLLVDPSTRLLRAIEARLADDALGKLLPQRDRITVESYQWKAGAVSTSAPAADAFAVQLPKDFAKVGETAVAKDAPPAKD